MAKGTPSPLVNLVIFFFFFFADGIKNHWLSQDSIVTSYLEPHTVLWQQLEPPQLPLPWWEARQLCSSGPGSTIFGLLVTPDLGKYYLCLHHFLGGGVCWK